TTPGSHPSRRATIRAPRSSPWSNTVSPGRKLLPPLPGGSTTNTLSSILTASRPAASGNRDSGLLLAVVGVRLADRLVTDANNLGREIGSIPGAELADADGCHRHARRHLDNRQQGIPTVQITAR